MRKQKLLSLVLTLMVLISVLGTVAFADNSKEQLSINFTTDKKEYKQGEDVNIEINIKNTSGKDLKEVEVKNTLPKGLEIKSNPNGEKVNKNTVKWHLGELKKDDSVNLKLSSTFNEYKGVVPVPNTGTDNYNHLLVGFVLLIIASSGIIYIKKNPTKFDKTKATGVGMALVMTFGVVGQSLVIADATSDSNSINIIKIFKLKCDGKELDNILEVKGAFIENIEVEKPEDTEKPEGTEKPEDVEMPDNDIMNPDNPKWNIDTDNDGLMDAEEELLGTNPNKVDTDGDGLNDKFEVESGLDPNKKDSDDNGTLDSEEDLDNDGLKNIDEQKYNTSAIIDDTDSDGLSDYEEINKYNTNPLEEDTDKDGIIDGKEIELGIDPTKKDSNRNGINDGDEKYEVDVETPKSDKDKNVDVNISGNITGKNIDDLYIINMEGAHEFISSDIPGYVVAPFRVGTNGDSIENVNITFTLNEEVVKNNAGDEFALYKYNKEKQELEIVSESQKLSYKKGKVFEFVYENVKLGKEYIEYILLNKTKWDEAWSKEMIDPGNESGLLDIVLTIDSSGSMDWNDPNDLRKQESIDFINKLEGENRAAVVDFDSSAKVRQGLTTDKALLQSAINKIDSSGGTNISKGLRAAIDELDPSKTLKTNVDYDKYTTYEDEEENQKNNDLEKIKDIDYIENISTIEETFKQIDSSSRNKFIMLLTDGESTIDHSLIEEAKIKNIKIYTIGLGSGIDSEALENISTETGGKYQYGETPEDFEEIFKQLEDGTINLIQDTDGDGIPDYFEENMRLVGGIFIKLDPNKKDTDNDGIDDGEEITGKKNPTPEDFHSMYIKEQKAFKYRSRPDLYDTDGDGIIDGEEKNDASDASKDVTITGKLLLKAAQLSYENTMSNIGGDVNTVNFVETDLNTRGLEDIGSWRIIDSDDPYEFGAVALKNGDKIIISYTGSQPPSIDPTDFPDIWQDWFLGHGGAFIFGNQYKHNSKARVFLRENIKNVSPNTEVYITGHSLGGYLTQVAAHYMYDHLENGSKLLKSATTFNPEPVMTAGLLHDHLEGQSLNVVNKYGYRDKENKKDPFIHHNHIKNDFLWLGGKIFTFAGKQYDPIDQGFIIDILGAHKIENFYKNISSIRMN